MAASKEPDFSSMRVRELKTLITELGGQIPTGSLEKTDLVELVQKLRLSQNEESDFFLAQLQIGDEIGNANNTDNAMEKMLLGFAKNMLNFTYIIGDASAKKVFLIDPAWDPMGLLAYCAERDLEIAGCILTHYHVDHAGGIPPPPFNAFGIVVPGAKEIIEAGIPVYCHQDDIPKLCNQISIDSSQVESITDGHTFQIGNFEVECIHTPGHTRGSMVVTCKQENCIITGDTVFPGSCGKLEDDWPESCRCMHNTLMKLSETLDDSMCIYPGHRYGPPTSTVGTEKASGFLRPCSFEEFQSRFQTSNL